MKKLLSIIISIAMLFSLCGCEIIEDFGISQVWDELKSGFEEVIVNDSQVVEITVEEYYIKSPQFNSCYKALNSKQKGIYEILYSAAEQMPEGFIKLCKNYDGIMTDIHLAYTALLNDHTEIFWMPATYLVGKTSVGSRANATIAFKFSGEENSVSYPVSKTERDSMRKELEAIVEQIVSKTAGCDSQYEKELIFNDYICKNTEYNTEARLSNTSYGCLVIKQALCEGYSRAFKLLCNEVDIECDLICGISEGEGHMWNSVNIDSTHSFVDVTWNDSQEGLEHFYFNITEEQLKYDHSFSPLYNELSHEELQSGMSFNFVIPKCTFTGNSYYSKSNLYINYDYAEKAADVIGKNAKLNIMNTSFLIDSENIISEFEADPDKFLSNIQYRLSDVILTSYIFKRDVLVVFYEPA